MINISGTGREEDSATDHQVGSWITLEAAQDHLTREGIAENHGRELQMKRPKGL